MARQSPLVGMAGRRYPLKRLLRSKLNWTDTPSPANQRASTRFVSQPPASGQVAGFFQRSTFKAGSGKTRMISFSRYPNPLPLTVLQSTHPSLRRYKLG